MLLCGWFNPIDGSAYGDQPCDSFVPNAELCSSGARYGFFPTPRLRTLILDTICTGIVSSTDSSLVLFESSLARDLLLCVVIAASPFTPWARGLAIRSEDHTQSGKIKDHCLQLPTTRRFGRCGSNTLDNSSDARPHG